MDPTEGGGDNRGEGGAEKRDIRRPMNAFLIFCKRHRSMVREKHPDRDNRSVTRILGDLWANLAEEEKMVYTNLAKQYKDAFMKAHPDYKWHSSEKVSQPGKMATRPTNTRPPRRSSTSDFPADGGIMPGQLADPEKMGGLNLLLMAGQHTLPVRDKPVTSSSISERRMTSPDLTGANAALLQLAEMCSSELRSAQADSTALRSAPPKKRARHWSYSEFGHTSTASLIQSSQPLPSPLKSDLLHPILSVPADQASSTLASQSEMFSVKGSKDKKHQPVSTSSSSAPPDRPQLSPANQNPSKSDIPSEDIKLGNESSRIQPTSTTSMDIGMPPKKKFTKLQEACKMETPASDACPTAAAAATSCLSDQNDNAIFTCGKLVVSHIIDRLFSASLTADESTSPQNLSPVDIEKARKILTADINERDRSDGSTSRETGRLLSEVVHKPQNLVEKVIEEAYSMDLKQFGQLGAMISVGQQEVSEKDAKPLIVKPDLKPSSEETDVKPVLEETDLRPALTETDMKPAFTETDIKPALTETDMKPAFTEMDMKPAFTETDLEPAFTETDMKPAFTNTDIKPAFTDTDVKPFTTKTTGGLLEKTQMSDQAQLSEKSSQVLSCQKEWAVTNAGAAGKDEWGAKLPETNMAESSVVLREEHRDFVQDEDENFTQPVRKSQRRNRGQRYQELINEGIIQPSKERLAARRHEQTAPCLLSCHTGDDTGFDEEGERHPHGLKRSISELESFNGDEKRYRTGDFDLEAEIATLPPCSLEQVTKRRPSRKRSDSESSRRPGCPLSPSADDGPALAFKTYQHGASPPKPEPLTGSQKRKARKHSISRLVASTEAESGGSLKSPGIVATVPLVRDATVTCKQDVFSAEKGSKPETSLFFPSSSTAAGAATSTSTAAPTTTLLYATMTTTSIPTTAMTTTVTTAAVTSETSFQSSQRLAVKTGKEELCKDTASVISRAAQKIQHLVSSQASFTDKPATVTGALSSSQKEKKPGQGKETWSIPKMAVVSSEFTNLKELDDDTWIPCYIPKGELDTVSTIYANSSDSRTASNDQKGTGGARSSKSGEEKSRGASKVNGTSHSKDKSSVSSLARSKLPHGRSGNPLGGKVSGRGVESKVDGRGIFPSKLLSSGTTNSRPVEKTLTSDALKPEKRLDEQGKNKSDSVKLSQTGLYASTALVTSLSSSKPHQTTLLLNSPSTSGITSTTGQSTGGKTNGGITTAIFQVAKSSIHSGNTASSAQVSSRPKEAQTVPTLGSREKHVELTGNPKQNLPALHTTAETEAATVTSINYHNDVKDSARASPSANPLFSQEMPVSSGKPSSPSAVILSAVTVTQNSDTTSAASLNFSTLSVVSSSDLLPSSVSLTTSATTPSLDLEMMDGSSQMLCQSPLPGSPSVGVVHS